MAKLPVRTTGGERRRTPVEGEPLGMRADPFRQVAPFSTGDDEPARFKPDFQIEKTEDSFVFKADLPGIKENEVDIAVTGNRLTISGHIYDSRACSYAGFTRAFTLPEGNDGNRQDPRRARSRRVDGAVVEAAGACAGNRDPAGRRSAGALGIGRRDLRRD